MNQTKTEFYVLAIISLAIFASVMQASCAPSQPSLPDAYDYVNNLQFVKHKNGLCFGVVKFVTYNGFVGTSITQVDAKACGAERER